VRHGNSRVAAASLRHFGAAAATPLRFPVFFVFITYCRISKRTEFCSW
jgi:hypothetical protein